MSELRTVVGLENAGMTNGEVRAFDPETAARTREFPFTISTGSRDRYATKLNPKGWELALYRRNPIIGYMHNVYGDECNAPDPDMIIGKSFDTGLELVSNTLISTAQFEPAEENELAGKVMRKLLRGTLNAVSVGFKPLEKPYYGEGDEARDGSLPTQYLNRSELLEWSVVNIPGNGEALGRSFRNQTAHALMFLRRATGLEFRDIEKLTITDVLKLLDKGHVLSWETPEVLAAPVSEVTAALEESRVDPVSFSERLTQRIRAAFDQTPVTTPPLIPSPLDRVASPEKSADNDAKWVEIGEGIQSALRASFQIK